MKLIKESEIYKFPLKKTKAEKKNANWQQKKFLFFTLTGNVRRIVLLNVFLEACHKS